MFQAEEITMCKGPNVGHSFAYARNSKAVSVTDIK